MEEPNRQISKSMAIVVVISMLFMFMVLATFIVNRQIVNDDICPSVQTECPPLYVCGGRGFVLVCSFDPELWFLHLRQGISR